MGSPRIWACGSFSILEGASSFAVRLDGRSIAAVELGIRYQKLGPGKLVGATRGRRHYRLGLTPSGDDDDDSDELAEICAGCRMQCNGNASGREM